MGSNKAQFDRIPFINHAPIIFLAAFLFLLILSILILSWVPPVSKDALSHHLAVPKLYLTHGGIYEIPAGFSKKNNLGRRDLLDIRDLLYPWPLQ